MTTNPSQYIGQAEIPESIIEDLASESGLDTEVVEAFIEAFGYTQDNLPTAEDIQDAYQGYFSSYEEFAQDMAESTGALDNKPQSWPLSCIDWTHAARELMYNYAEHSGHYFRNI